MTDADAPLALVLALIRSTDRMTRPELVRQSGLSRAVVNQRVEQALELRLVEETSESISTGGRPSTTLRVRDQQGRVLAAVFGASRLHVAVTDLSGRVLRDRVVSWDVDAGPEASLTRLESLGRALLDEEPAPLWAVGLGVPGPVEFASGTLVAPPIMDGWDNFHVGARLERMFGTPAWVDNDVNLMTLGAWKATRSEAGDNVVLLKAGTGIGIGLISQARLHRGARGSAGDLGHVSLGNGSTTLCRCGKTGCLEASAGGWAIARDMQTPGALRSSPFLAAKVAETGTVTVEDVIAGALLDDETCRTSIRRSAEMIGGHLSALVSILNPSTLFLAGSLTRVGDLFSGPVREAIQRGSLPLGVEELVITEVPLNHSEGVIGAAALVLDQLFSASMLQRWIPTGSPAGFRDSTSQLFGSDPSRAERERFIR